MHKDEADAIDDAFEMRDLSLCTTGTPMVIIAPKRRIVEVRKQKKAR
jgi:hypothetical protein